LSAVTDASAAMQGALTQSAIQIQIQENQGKAELQRRQQEALVMQAVGNTEAAVIKAKGLAQAESTRAQVEAFQGEGADNQLKRVIAENFADAIVRSPNAIVPNVSVGGSAGGGGTLVEAMLALVLADKSRPN